MNEKELLGFLGINIIMGYHKLPSRTHYWNQDHDLCVPYVADVMSRDRFGQILSHLHVNDNTAVPDNNKDKLFKIRPLITKLNSNYMKLYNVRQVVSIDESMILFKGRHSIKQYNPMKPIKRGYKLWVREDLDGYISKFDVYQGKHQSDVLVPNAYDGIGLGEKVVVNFSKDLLGKYHQVYFDNYFNSVPLMQYLKANAVMACGTIRANRKGLPTGLIPDKGLQRGDFDHRVSTEGLVLYKWKDSKVVYLLSNFHGTETAKVGRTQKDGRKKDIPCPVAMKDYNNNMFGVDKADQLCAIYGIDRKSKKWWHRIFFGMIDRTIVNAQIVHNKLSAHPLNSLNFRRSVAQTLIALSKPRKPGRPVHSMQQPTSKKRRRSHTASVSSAIRLQNRGAHWVEFDPKKRGRCEVCSSKGTESRPHSTCSLCKVFLCCNVNKNCFKEFHDI